MNEGENSAVPQNPNFSSPNISSSNQTQLSSAPSTERNITSSDISAMAGTDAGAVAAAAAAMPEGDSRQVISSMSVTSSSVAPRSRFGFSNRKFDTSVQQAVKQSTFASMPKYFNQAAATQDKGVFLTNNYEDDKKPKNGKIFILAGLVAAVILVLIIALVSKTSTEMAKTNNLKATWNEFASLLLFNESKKEPITINDNSAAASDFLNRAYSKDGISDDAKYAKVVAGIDAVINENGDAKRVNVGDLHDLKEQLSLVYYVAKLGPIPNAESIAACYVVLGKETCNVQIDEHYNKYYETHNDAIQRISQLQLGQITFEKIFADAYIANGCIGSNGTVQKTCTGLVDSSETIVVYAGEYKAAKNAASKNTLAFVKGFLTDLKTINDEMSNEK